MEIFLVNEFGRLSLFRVDQRHLFYFRTDFSWFYEPVLQLLPLPVLVVVLLQLVFEAIKVQLHLEIGLLEAALDLKLLACTVDDVARPLTETTISFQHQIVSLVV